MERFKKSLLGLLAASLALLVGFQIFETFTLDRTAPVITCPDSVLATSVSAAEEVLLHGVQARDDRDGDLTAHVVVERLSAMNMDRTRQVTYAVMDAAGNVGRTTRTVQCTDYQLPRLHLSAPLRISSQSKFNELLNTIQADSVLDGDLSSNIKFNFTSSYSVFSEGSYPIELRVNDSAGNSMVIPTTLEIYDPREEVLPVELTQYIVYLPKGSSFDPAQYYKAPNQPAGGEPMLSMTFHSNVDMSTPGVYHVDYTVKNTASGDYGKSRLIVAVEG